MTFEFGYDSKAKINEIILIIGGHRRPHREISFDQDDLKCGLSKIYGNF